MEWSCCGVCPLVDVTKFGFMIIGIVIRYCCHDGGDCNSVSLILLNFSVKVFMDAKS